MSVIRVLIADDHEFVRIGVEQYLANHPDIRVVGTAANGRDAVDAATTLVPDVVLMDLMMPEMDGVEATRRIRAVLPDVRILVLTSFSDRDRIVDAIDSGAIGYLLKDAEPEDLLRGIRTAARGESLLSPRAATALIEARRDRFAPPAELTQREREVLTLVGEGLANKQIARKLGIAEKTVKAHLTSAFQRIGVGDRTAAALWAERNGLLRQPPDSR